MRWRTQHCSSCTRRRGVKNDHRSIKKQQSEATCQKKKKQSEATLSMVGIGK